MSRTGFDPKEDAVALTVHEVSDDANCMVVYFGGKDGESERRGKLMMDLALRDGYAVRMTLVTYGKGKEPSQPKKGEPE